MEAKFRAAVTADPFRDGLTEEQMAEYSEQLASWSYQGGSLRPEFIPEGNLESFPMGRDFGLALQAWALQLEWPALPVQTQDELGVTYLELLTHFVAWGRSLPPLLVFDNKQARYVSHSDIAAWLLPNSLATCVGSFQAALLQFRQCYHVDLVPGPFCRNQTHLRRLGLEAPQNGVLYRPVFPHAEGWLQVLRRVCEDSQMRHLEALLPAPSC